MPIPSLTPLTATYTHFFLAIEHCKTHTNIEMQLLKQIVNTRDLPDTYAVLKRMLPTVLQSQCFNDQKIPFSREVKSTELGHLFEHILLEYLCLQKMAQGCRSATFNGVTNWNWKKDKWGTFHIMVDAGYKDLPIFSRAMEKTIHLMHILLEQSAQQHSLSPIPTMVTAKAL
jgi:hypothetical protein